MLSRISQSLAIVAFCCTLLCTGAKADTRDTVSKLLAEANFVAAKSLAQSELDKAQPRGGLESAYWQNQLGMIARAVGEYSKARSWFGQSLRTRTKFLGQHHKDTAVAMNNLALVEEKLGHLQRARRLLTRALKTNMALLGPSHSFTVSNLSNLGLLNLSLGNFREAREQLTTALTRTTSVEGWRSDNAATALSNLASFHITTLEFGNAEKLLLQALAVDEYRHGASHPFVATTLNNLGELYRLKGKATEAESAYRRAAEIDRTFTGSESTDYAIDQLNLAALYQLTGNYHGARTALEIALSTFQKILPDNVENAAIALSELGRLLWKQGDEEHALLMYHKAIHLFDIAFGSSSAETLQPLTDLATLYAARNDKPRVLKYMHQALRVARRSFGAQSPHTTRTMLALANALENAHEPDEAQKWLRKVEPLIRLNFGNSSIDAAYAELLQGRMLLQTRNQRSALRHARRALLLFQKLLPQLSYDIVDAHDLLSQIYEQQHDWRKSTFHASQASRIVAINQMGAASNARKANHFFRRDVDAIHLQAIRASVEAVRLAPGQTRYIASAFETADLMRETAIEEAMKSGALKFHVSNSRQLALLGRHSLLASNLEDLDHRIRDALLANRYAYGLFDHQLENLNQETRHALEVTDAELQRTVPNYREIRDQRLLTFTEMQQLLRDGEMLLYLLPSGNQTLALATTNRNAVASTLSISTSVLEAQISKLRTGLDPSKWKNTYEPFDRALAYHLYNVLLKPVEPMINHASTLYYVSGAPLASLPLAALVTSAPEGGAAGDSSPELLRSTPWLAKKLAIVTMPSALALKRLRAIRPRSKATQPLLGIGTPVFSSGGMPRSRGILRHAELELRMLATSLHAPDQPNLLLGTQATKAAFYQADPGRRRIIAFATHAIDQRASGLGEPALVLSPADDAIGTNDGLLPASEIAGLDLQADWIILSACNTAGDGSTTTNSLTRAFFQAGARSMLVSHWPIFDRAAAQITVGTINNFELRPERGQADALRKAMISAMMDTSHPLNAHPTTWAAFSLVGEVSQEKNRMGKPDH